MVNAMNRVGASPDDLMQILQALDAVGALNAE
jgi:flagellar P-ring protein precursor FlgI